MLKTENVPLDQSALLVIDAQDSFMVRARWQRRSNPQFETNVAALIDAYRQAGRPVIYFLHRDAATEFNVDSPHYKLMDFLAPLPSEAVMHKKTRNCFTETGLQALLLEHGVRRLAITGIQMEQCCETTARLAADLGYAVDFVADGTMTFPIPNLDEPGFELDVASIEERTLYALRGRFARIVRTGDLVRELRELLPAAATA